MVPSQLGVGEERSSQGLEMTGEPDSAAILILVRTMRCLAFSIRASSCNALQPPIHDKENVSGKPVNNIPFIASEVVYEEVQEVTVRHTKDSKDHTAALDTISSEAELCNNLN